MCVCGLELRKHLRSECVTFCLPADSFLPLSGQIRLAAFLKFSVKQFPHVTSYGSWFCCNSIKSGIHMHDLLLNLHYRP